MTDEHPHQPPDAFSLTPTQRALRDRALGLARDRFSALASAGEPGRVNRPLVRALADTGLLGRLFPEELGGTADGEPSAMELCLLREGLAQGCTEAETALALQGLGAVPIVQSGTAQIRRRFVPDVAKGEAIAAFALTEPGAGSDPGSLSLTAVRVRDEWVLSGTKLWISNAPEADVYTVFARTKRDAGAKGITAFVVPGDAPGLSGEPLQMLAPHAIGRLELRKVRLSEEHVLGDVDDGLRVALATLDVFRPSVGAFAVGMAQAALDAAVRHASRREQFGRRLADFQGVSHRLADAATKLEAARLLVYRAAAAQDGGAARNTKRAAMAKLFATEVAQEVVDVAVQVHGAAALQAGHLLEHLYREVRAPRIYEGTSEIQRTIIARELQRELEDE